MLIAWINVTACLRPAESACHRVEFPKAPIMCHFSKSKGEIRYWISASWSEEKTSYLCQQNFNLILLFELRWNSIANTKQQKTKNEFKKEAPL